MKLDYGMLLSPEPISLSIGTLRKPTLREISRLSFDRFGMYEMFLDIDLRDFYETVFANGDTFWDSLSDQEKETITLYEAVVRDDRLQGSYCEVFDFFFVEKVIYRDGLFILLNDGVEQDKEKFVPEDIRGAITKNTFSQVIDLIRQICCIHNTEEEEKNMKFKNEAARKLYQRMKKARKEAERLKAKNGNNDFSIPNLISAVSNRHPCLSPLNVWDLTIFQLLDSFNRLEVSAIYDINWTRVAVWGDEKNKFDAALWYKNNQNKDSV